MRAEYVVRIRITREAAGLLIGLALVAFPSTQLSPADPLARELTMTTALPSPRGAYTSVLVSGKSILGQASQDTTVALNVALSTTSCMAHNLGDRYVDDTTMAGRLAAQPTGTQDPNRQAAHWNVGCRAAAPLDTNALRPVIRVQPGSNFDSIQESNNVKLFVRGDVWVDRLFWYRAAMPTFQSPPPAGYMDRPDFELTFWPIEIVGFNATQCTSGFNAATGLCNYGTYNPNAQEIVLDFFVKNGTGSVAHWGIWARHTSLNPPVGGDLGTGTPPGGASATPRLRTLANNCTDTSAGPAYQSCIGACNPVGSTYAIRINCRNRLGNCPQGQSCSPANFVTGTCGSTANPYFDIWAQCRFHVGQNVSANFPYRIDARLMCTKISAAEWAARCQGQSAVTRWQECNRACPTPDTPDFNNRTNPDALVCPFNPNLQNQINANGGRPGSNTEDCNYNPI